MTGGPRRAVPVGVPTPSLAVSLRCTRCAVSYPLTYRLECARCRGLLELELGRVEPMARLERFVAKG